MEARRLRGEVLRGRDRRVDNEIDIVTIGKDVVEIIDPSNVVVEFGESTVLVVVGSTLSRLEISR